MENQFLHLIAMTLDPNDQASQGIPQRVLAALKPGDGKDDKAAQVREVAARRVTASLYQGEVPRNALYPSAGARTALSGERPIPLLIPVSSFKILTEKIVRGITYVEDNRFIEEPCVVQFFPDCKAVQSLRDVLLVYGQTVARGPGVSIRKAVVPETVTGIFEIKFWQHFNTYAVVDVRDDLQPIP